MKTPGSWLTFWIGEGHLASISEADLRRRGGGGTDLSSDFAGEDWRLVLSLPLIQLLFKKYSMLWFLNF